MNRILVLAVVAATGVATAQAPPTLYDAGGGSGGGGSPLAALGPFPPFPGAGTVLATQAMPSFPTRLPQGFSPDTLGLDFDRSRGGGVIWAADQNRNGAFDTPSLFAISPAIPHG